jgi:predicted TIM-barrel fold metal-dependent hydrolase
LDNAVRQAEQRGLYDFSVFDIDVHQNEPFTLFSKYLPPRWKEKYTNERLLTLAQQADSEVYLAKDPVGLGLYEEISDRYSLANQSLGGRIIRTEVKGYEKRPRREWKKEEVIDTFTTRMHDIGIEQCLVFPSNLLTFGNHPNFDLQVAVANAYMDYMLDEFLGKYPDLFSCVYIPANTPDKSAELIDRTGSEKGIIGVMVTPSQPGPLAGEEAWNPIYEVAERKGLPIVFHSEANNLPPFNRFSPKKYLPIHALAFPFYLILQLTSIVIEGVPERFPNLKFVFVEGGVSWIPWIMQRLDSEYLMRRSEAPALSKLPSEYIRQFFFSSQPLEHPKNRRDLEWVFRTFDAENQLLYSSDYPHWDFDAPSVIYDLPFLTKEAKKKILGDNARRVFKIN